MSWWSGSSCDERESSRNKNAKTDKRIMPVIRFIISWGCGYVLMMASKWVLTSIVFRRSVMPQVKGHINERIADYGFISSLGNSVLLTLKKNLEITIPFCFGATGVAVGILLLVIFFYGIYVYQKKEKDNVLTLLYLAVMLIPFARFIIIRNHSFLHCFFTFRALIASFMGLGLIFTQRTDFRGLR